MAAIAIIGTGYVGLTTGACLAHLGHTVICADIDKKKIEELQKGQIPIYEAGLERLVEEGIRSDNLKFVVGAENASKNSDFHYLCLPTPQTDDGAADLSYLESAVKEIKDILPQNSVVINKSTVPVGTATFVTGILERQDVAVVSNPEFLREGSAVEDFLNPDRIVIGSNNEEAAIRVASLYARVTSPVLLTDQVSAELVKYAANTFLAAKLSFVNAISALCEPLGADVHDVIRGMGYDHRIGMEFCKPGPGWGGSCFPKDINALISIASEAGYNFSFLQEVVQINEDQFDRIAHKVLDSVEDRTKHVAVLGLSFKAETDDLRSSPSLEMIKRLRGKGIAIKAYDPAVSHEMITALYPDLSIEVTTDAYSAARGAAAVAIMTEWDEFSSLDFDKIAEVMEGDTIIDSRNVINPKTVERRGLKYKGISR